MRMRKRLFRPRHLRISPPTLPRNCKPVSTQSEEVENLSPSLLGLSWSHALDMISVQYASTLMLKLQKQHGQSMPRHIRWGETSFLEQGSMRLERQQEKG